MAEAEAQQQPVDPQQPYEILISGRLYDLRGFRHPAGSIIKFYTGTGDATITFEEFHYRISRARKLLQSLPSREAPPVNTAEAEKFKRLNYEYLKFRRELEEEGWFEPNYFHVVYRCVEIVAMYLGAYLLLLNFGYKMCLPAALIISITNGRCGWIQHEGGHYSLTGNQSVDKKIQEIYLALGFCMSGSWYRNQHNRHHAAPQKLQHDVDINTLPFVAYNKYVAQMGEKSPTARFFIPYQHVLFYPVISVVVSLLWFLYLHPKHVLQSKQYSELTFIIMRYVVWGVCGWYAGASFAQVFALWMTCHFIGSLYLFGNFALNHTHLAVVQNDQHAHWAEYAATYTMNISPHWFTNWWMGYLNYQVEHHMFPSMPQYKFTSLHPRVRKFFEDNGLHYDVRGYFESTRDTLVNLVNVSHSYDHLK